jgi:phosphoheptose isomerase
VKLTSEAAGLLEARGIDPGVVVHAAELVVATFRRGGKLLVFGNGGSAADAQHLAGELVGRFERDRAPLPAVALTTDTSALTAIGNDFGFDAVFERQLVALGEPGDAALGITTSGASENVLAALRTARARGLATIALTGEGGARLSDDVDVAVVIPERSTARIQEAHLVVEHVVCELIESELFATDHRFARPRRRPRGDVVSIDELLDLRGAWKEQGRVVVVTNGCFDVLHIGHLRSLEAAAALGDVLVVALNDDAAVRRLKGTGRPLMPAAERAELLVALAPVDYVVMFGQDDPSELLGQLRPDIHAKGEDYAPPNGKPMPERDVVERYGGRVEFLPLIEGRSTSALVTSMRGE